MSDVVIVTRDVGRRAENLIVAGGSATVLKGVELLLQENTYTPGSEIKVGVNQIDCSTLLKRGLSSLQAMPFDLLGIDLKSGTVDVRKAYKKLALKYHPDKNPKTTPLFQLIQNIQTKLTDSSERTKEAQQAHHTSQHRSARNGGPNPQPQQKPNFPPPKPTQSVYEQYKQQYQQFQQQQQQQQQSQSHQYHYGAHGGPTPNAGGFNYYDQARQEEYRRKNYYEDLLREQYRKAAEAEKRAKEYANKFQHDDIFQNYANPKPSRPSYPPSDSSTNSYQSKANNPDPQFNSYRNNPSNLPGYGGNAQSKSSVPSSSSASSQPNAYKTNYNSESSQASNQNQQKYFTGQTYRTTSDGRVYPQQQYGKEGNNKANPTTGANTAYPESSKYNYSYNPATGAATSNKDAANLNSNKTSPTNASQANNPATNIPSSSSNSGKASAMVPRPFAFKIVNKTSSVVELEWKTSSLYHCPLVVELSWKDHSKSNKVWEMSSKLIRSGVCRKKNLTAGAMYEFRVRCVEELTDGRVGSKSEWTESLLATLPLTDSKPTEPGRPTPTPDEQKAPPVQSTKSKENVKPSPSTDSINPNEHKKKAPISATAKSPSRKASAREERKGVDLNSEKSPNGKKFRRFNSKFGSEEKHYMEQQDDSNSHNPRRSAKKEKEAEVPSLSKQHRESFLSASARLAWGKETLGREGSSGNATPQKEKRYSFEFHEDVTYLEVDEEIEDEEEEVSSRQPRQKLQKNPMKGGKVHVNGDDDSAAEIEEDEALKNQGKPKNQKNHHSRRPSNSRPKEQEDQYQEDFEIIDESVPLTDRSGMPDPVKSSKQRRSSDPPMKAKAMEADEVESEYTDSDTSSIPNQKDKKGNATASSGKPPKPKSGDRRAITPPDLSTSQNSNLPGSESDNNFDVDEERLFLLYPPKNTDTNPDDNRSKRIYRHPVHKEPFLRSEVKGYLLVDQNVLAGANCGEWLRVKYHISSKHGRTNHSDDWGWCLRKDKQHVYLRPLEGRKMTVLSDNEEKNSSYSNNNSRQSSAKRQKPVTESKGSSQSTSSSTTATNGIAANTMSFRSPPAAAMKRKASAANILNQSLRNLPKPTTANPNPLRGRKSAQKSSDHKKGAQASYPNSAREDEDSNRHPQSIEEWIECFDEHGNVYYFNEQTGQSKWEPPEWFEEKDPTTGAKYYVHVTMQGDENINFHSTWTKPEHFCRLIRPQN